MPTIADDAGGHRGAAILEGERAELILECLIHVDDTRITIVSTEYGRTVGFTNSIRLAPMDLEFLTGVAFDLRDFHPHAGLAMRRFPFLNLIGQGLASRRKPQVLALGLGLAEIKTALVQAQQQRETVHRRALRQVRALRCG